MSSSEWTDLTVGDFRSWGRHLPNDGWLNVRPTGDGIYEWQYRGPDRDQHDHGILHGKGTASSAEAAMQDADAAARAAKEA